MSSGTFRVEIDADKLVQALTRCPDTLLRHLAEAMEQAGMLLEREVKERTPTSGAGTLRDSIGASPVRISGEAVSIGVGSSLAYVAPVELGSRPHMPPVEPIADWVRRKLGLMGDEARSVAYAIAMKIKARGTEGAFMFRDGLAAVAPQVEGLVAQAVERALASEGLS